MWDWCQTFWMFFKVLKVLDSSWEGNWALKYWTIQYFYLRTDRLFWEANPIPWLTEWLPAENNLKHPLGHFAIHRYFRDISRDSTSQWHVKNSWKHSKNKETNKEATWRITREPAGTTRTWVTVATRSKQSSEKKTGKKEEWYYSTDTIWSLKYD